MGSSHSSWKLVSGPSVGRTGNARLLPRATLDKLVLGSEGKAAEEGWGGKLVELASHGVCCSLEVVPRAVHTAWRVGRRKVRGSKGCKSRIQ